MAEDAVDLLRDMNHRARATRDALGPPPTPRERFEVAMRDTCPSGFDVSIATITDGWPIAGSNYYRVRWTRQSDKVRSTQFFALTDVDSWNDVEYLVAHMVKRVLDGFAIYDSQEAARHDAAE